MHIKRDGIIIMFTRISTVCVILLLVLVVLDLSCTESSEDINKPIEFRDLSGLSEDSNFLNGPYLMNTTQTSVTIMWETELPSDSKVDYGLTADYGFSVSDTSLATIHEITLNDLTPETTYHYSIISGEQRTNDLSFMTAVNKNSSFRFMVISDTQTNYEISSTHYDHMFDRDPFFILHGGDIVGNGPTYAEWKEQLFDPIRKLGHYVPLFAAIGNHERDSHWFYDYVSYPNTENNYSFTYGNAFFLVLDTNNDSFEFVGGEIRDWFLNEINSDECKNATWRFAIHHQPAWTEGGGSSCDYNGTALIRETIVPPLQEAGFHFVFNGHVHGYEKGYLSPTYFITAGGGGGSLDSFCRDIDHIFKAFYVHHFIQMDITGNVLEMTVIDMEGEVIDYLRMNSAGEVL